MKIIDGHKIAAKIEARLKTILPPGLTLAILALDDDQAGKTYTRLKQTAAARIGIKVITSNNPAVLDLWADDPAINGILIQYPGWRGSKFARQWQEWLKKIPTQKDVDGLRPDSLFTPATVKAVEVTLRSVRTEGIPLRSGKILIVGKGMVGRALAKRLNTKIISSHDKNLITECRKADILIAACGRPGIIKTVKPGAVVIDVGWPKGDVDFDAVKGTAGRITPVPGGVGPVTVICLLENLLRAV